jgi:hypothetical protein
VEVHVAARPGSGVNSAASACVSVFSNHVFKFLFLISSSVRLKLG